MTLLLWLLKVRIYASETMHMQVDGSLWVVFTIVQAIHQVKGIRLQVVPHFSQGSSG